MGGASSAQEITLFSPTGSGPRRGDWRKVTVFLASKTCLNCGASFRPWIKRNVDGSVESAMKPSAWEKQRYCSISCSKVHANPMADETTRDRVSATLRRLKHGPRVQGGNGRGLTQPQQMLASALGPEWVAEFIVCPGLGRGNGYPTNYKIDLAHPTLMVAIEIDGPSHNGKRREIDAKKDALLTSFGWRVCRISNATVESLCLTCRSPDTLLSSLMAF